MLTWFIDAPLRTALEATTVEALQEQCLQWADVLRVIFAALVSVVSTIFSVFTLSYAVNTMQIDRSTMLTVLILANLVALGAIPAFAALADRIGRRPVFIFGALAIGTVTPSVLVTTISFVIYVGSRLRPRR